MECLLESAVFLVWELILFTIVSKYHDSVLIIIIINYKLFVEVYLIGYWLKFLTKLNVGVNIIKVIAPTIISNLI